MTVPLEAQLRFRDRLRELGFDSIRFAAIDPRDRDLPPGERDLSRWLAEGMQADMHWMERSLPKRLDPSLVLPNARSFIMLGVNYWRGEETAGRSSRAPVWARYAVYDDYHDTFKPALVAAGRALEEIFGVGSADYRYYVDTGPVIERGWAARAGTGFVGKNAMLISREYGNWLFLAAIVTSVALAPDAPIRQPATQRAAANPETARRLDETNVREPPVGVLCGKCTRCLDACPTDAFARPGVVDARRCISYQTIENKAVIPRELRAGIGNRIYGCDVCLEVCPWNRFAREGRQMLLAVRDDVRAHSLGELLDLTPEQFSAAFRRTPIKRLKLVGLLRNACVVAGNSGDATLLPQLTKLARSHPAALVRAHAVWAVYRLHGASGLDEARLAEQDPLVLAEYAAEADLSLRPA